MLGLRNLAAYLNGGDRARSGFDPTFADEQALGGDGPQARILRNEFAGRGIVINQDHIGEQPRHRRRNVWDQDHLVQQPARTGRQVRIKAPG